MNNDEFGPLRIRASKLRDSRIAYAKREYELTLASIAKLEQESSRRKKISACIESVIPNDREFTRRHSDGDPAKLVAGTRSALKSNVVAVSESTDTIRQTHVAVDRAARLSCVP